MQPPAKLQLAKRPPSPAGPIPPSEVVPDDVPEEGLVMPEEAPGDVPDAEPDREPEEEPNGVPDGEPDDAPEEEPDDAPEKEPDEEPEVDPLDTPALPPFPEFGPVPAQAPSANKAARPDPPPRESHCMRRNEGFLRTAVIKVSAPRIVAPAHGLLDANRHGLASCSTLGYGGEHVLARCERPRRHERRSDFSGCPPIDKEPHVVHRRSRIDSHA